MTVCRRGLGRTAAHLIDHEGTTSVTVCGLGVDERLSVGTVVQKPGVTWPLRRCKRCWPDADAAYPTGGEQERMAA